MNYSNGLASCLDNLHAVLLVEAILGISLHREAVGLSECGFAPSPRALHQGSLGATSGGVLHVQPGASALPERSLILSWVQIKKPVCQLAECCWLPRLPHRAF